MSSSLIVLSCLIYIWTFFLVDICNVKWQRVPQFKSFYILRQKMLVFISVLLLHCFHQVPLRPCTDRNNESSFFICLLHITPKFVDFFDTLHQKFFHILLSWETLYFLQNLLLHDSPALLENTQIHRARTLLPSSFPPCHVPCPVDSMRASLP